ncbi:hypothetical protein Tco_0019018 [Tanacetum coccineum]
MIRDIRNWDWFLEEHKEYSDEDAEYEVSNKKAKKGKKGERGRKVGKDTTKSYAMDVDVEDDDEDENDETLGGFIVDDEDAGEGIYEDEDEETDEDDEDVGI